MQRLNNLEKFLGISIANWSMEKYYSLKIDGRAIPEEMQANNDYIIERDSKNFVKKKN